MSGKHSDYVTESGVDSAYSPQTMHAVQGPSRALLDYQEVHPRIADWSHDTESPGLEIAVQQYTFSHGPDSVPRSFPSDNTSSMALTQQSLATLSSTLPSSVPSLGSYPSVGSRSSIRSSAASAAVRPGLLDDEGHFVDYANLSNHPSGGIRSPAVQHPAGIACLFGFLGCTLTFQSPRGWYDHSKSHFRGLQPPKQLHCPYSTCAWSISSHDGEEAWAERWEHLEDMHDVQDDGRQLREKRDSRLFDYLWIGRIVDSAQLQELRRCGQLGSDDQPFVASERSERRRRQAKGPIPRTGNGGRR